MDFSYSPKVVDLQKRLTAFMEEHIYPAEAVYHHEVAENRKAGNPWQPTKVMEELKAQARAAEQGPPRGEGCVPIPAKRSFAREGGRRVAPQGVVKSGSRRHRPRCPGR